MENLNEIDQKVKTILVVDDEISLLESISIKLAKSGFSVLRASNGVIGLEMALKNHPDLILLDVVMPNMDGFTMLHKLRQDIWGRFASVIILTNQDVGNEQLTHLVRDEPSYYLVKASNTLDQIVEKVREILY